jgi:hypothetical protein
LVFIIQQIYEGKVKEEELSSDSITKAMMFIKNEIY